MKKLFLSAALLLGATMSGWAEESPGYLDLNGTDRFMLIPNSEAFDIAAGGSITVALDVKPVSYTHLTLPTNVNV